MNLTELLDGALCDTRVNREAVIELGVVQVFRSDNPYYGPRLHLDRRCAESKRNFTLAPEAQTQRHYMTPLRSRPVPMKELLARQSLCDRCGDRVDFLDAVVLRIPAKGRLVAERRLGAIVELDVVLTSTPDCGIAAWRYSLARAAASDWAEGVIEDFHERVEGLQLSVEEWDHAQWERLTEWARRLEFGRTHRGAPVGPDILAGRLGGTAVIEREFRRWSETDPAHFVPTESFEVLYERWQQGAHRLEAPCALVLWKNAPLDEDSPILEWLDPGTGARLLPRPVAELFAEKFSPDGVELCSVECSDPMAVGIAVDLLARGVPLDQAARLAAGAVD